MQLRSLLLALFLAARLAAAETPYSHGLAALSRGEADAAIAALETAAQAEPRNSEIQRHLGDAYGLAAQHGGVFAGLRLAKKVRAAYEQAVALDPANLDARQSLLEFYLAAPAMLGGGADKAAAQAAAIRERDGTRGHFAAAFIQLAAKNYAATRAELAAVLAVAPQDYSALYQTGRVAALSGEEVVAGIAALRRCLTLPVTPGAPSHAAANWRLGLLLEKQGDVPAARTAYRASLILDPEFKESKDALARLEAK